MSNPPMKLTMEQAIDRLGIGRFQHKVMIAAGMTTASDAVEVLLLSFLTIVVQEEFGVGPNEGSMLTSIVFLGALCGTLMLAPSGDTIGRKPIFLIASTIVSISGLLTALSSSYSMMLVFRFGVGFGLGGAVVAYDCVAELLPQQNRGSYLLLMGYWWALGTLTTPAVAYLSLQEAGSWRLFVLVCSFPCVISTFLALIWVPESPRWLVAHGKEDKALGILRKAAVTNGKDPMDTFPEGVLFISDPNEETEMHSLTCLLKKEWRGLTLTLWGLWAGQAFMYWGTIQIVTLVFSDTDAGNLPGAQMYSFDYMAIFSSSMAEIVGQTIAILVVDRIGRTLPMSVLYLLGGISVVGLCMLAETRTADRSTLIVFAFLARMFVMGGNGLCWLVTAELIPTPIRNTGHAAAYAVARIAGASSPWLVSTENSFQTIGIAMGIISLYTASVACILPDTRGKAMGTAGSFGADDATAHNVSEII